MKKIFISLALAFALTLTACNTNDNPESSETQPASASSTTSETQKIELTSEETQAPEEESAKVFERVSYADLPDAEQIYSSLYSLAEFNYYLQFEARKDLDMKDAVYIEKLHQPLAGLDDKTIGTSYSAAYCRIANGRMSNGVDLAAWIDSFASGVYTAQGLSDFFDRFIIVSDGKIYIHQYAYGLGGNWLVTSGLTLDEITTVNDYTIQLKFSFVDYGIEIGSMPEETEYFTVVMSNRLGGWKVDSYSLGYGMTALINQLFKNEDLAGDDVPDLLAQLEEYIARHPISTAPTEETENSGTKKYSSCFIAPDPNTDPESVKFYDSYDCTPGYLYFNNARKQLLLDKKFKEAGYFQNDQLFYGITEENELIEVDKSSGQYETVYKSDDDVKELDYSCLVILDDKGNESDMKGRLLYIRTDNSIVIIERETKEYSVISCPDGVSEIRTVGWQENEKNNNKNDDVYICEECGYDGNYVIWRDNDGSWFWYHPETGENEPLTEMDTNKSYFVKAN